jgi:hypothetical protein
LPAQVAAAIAVDAVMIEPPSSTTNAALASVIRFVNLIVPPSRAE